MSDETPSEPREPVPAAPDDDSFARTLLQFFVVPAIVVAVCVGVFFFFAWLISDEKTGVDYLREIRMGSANRRWQAAFELSKIITTDSEKSRLDGLVPQMVEAFERAKGDDPRVRHYLALSLGHLGDTSASPVLISALKDTDATTRLYSCWALGNLKDASAVGPVLERFSDEDAGVRKMAVYAAGAIGDRRAIPQLEASLDDPERDVSWNAAVALAKLGDAAGEAKLLEMLDREFLGRVSDMNEAQKLLAMESAVKAAALLGTEALTQRLQEIGSKDPNLGIRKSALEALSSIRRSAEIPHP